MVLKMPVDYSKWKNLEVSDDEDDTRSKSDVDKECRRQIERIKKKSESRQLLEERESHATAALDDVNKKLANSFLISDEQKRNDKKEKEKLDVARLKLEKEAADFEQKARIEKWHGSIIVKPTLNLTTVLDKERNSTMNKKEELTDDEDWQRFTEFVQKNKENIETYSKLKKYDDSEQYLLEHPELLCEHTAVYLLKFDDDDDDDDAADSKLQMEHVAHQAVIVQFIVDISQKLGIDDPRKCVPSFFSAMQHPEKKYRENFNKELAACMKRIRARILKRRKEREEEEERKERVGPGGLDPLDVFETLPEVLQECFEQPETINETLNPTLMSLPTEWALYHMNRCIKSGLWVQTTDERSIYDLLPADLPPPTTGGAAYAADLAKKREECKNVVLERRIPKKKS